MEKEFVSIDFASKSTVYEKRPANLRKRESISEHRLPILVDDNILQKICQSIKL